MEQIKSFADERHAAFCAGCGGVPETRDHVPSKVLLDEPYPENLPVVGVCASCNHGVSLDEEYTACVIECARLGVQTAEEAERPKIQRILAAKPRLAAMIAETRRETPDGIRLRGRPCKGGAGDHKARERACVLRLK